MGIQVTSPSRAPKGEPIFRYLGFVPLRRKPYLFLQITLLATSLILLGLTVVTRAVYGPLPPFLRTSQLMLAIGATAQSLEVIALLRGRR